MAGRRFVLPRVGHETVFDLGRAVGATREHGDNLPAERSSADTVAAPAPAVMPESIPVALPESVPVATPEPIPVVLPESVPVATPEPAEAPFYGTGRPVQTSIALDEDCAALLDRFARGAGVSVNALAVAAVHLGLPSEVDDTRAMICDERIRRAGSRTRRLERNLRLPEDLRSRIDELVSAVRANVPRATRADLVNAALRHGLPADGKRAGALVVEHAQRAERAALA